MTYGRGTRAGKEQNCGVWMDLGIEVAGQGGVHTGVASYSRPSQNFRQKNFTAEKSAWHKIHKVRILLSVLFEDQIPTCFADISGL